MLHCLWDRSNVRWWRRQRQRQNKDMLCQNSMHTYSLFPHSWRGILIVSHPSVMSSVEVAEQTVSIKLLCSSLVLWYQVSHCLMHSIVQPWYWLVHSPAVHSVEIGHHYGHCSNHFWHVSLSLVSEVVQYLMNGEVIAALGDHTITKRINLGMVSGPPCLRHVSIKPLILLCCRQILSNDQVQRSAYPQ